MFASQTPTILLVIDKSKALNKGGPTAMHFINAEYVHDTETGQLYACRLSFQSLFTNSIASVAFYGELWHRLRRDNILSCQLDEEAQHVFDATLYFRGVPAIDCDSLDAAIMLNNATGTNSFELQHCSAEATVTAWLERMDSLTADILQNKSYAPQLKKISHRFVTKSQPEANADLKNLLKAYCREQGFYVDSSDVKAARAQLKEQRRQAFQDGVKSGQITIPYRDRSAPASPAAQ